MRTDERTTVHETLYKFHDYLRAQHGDNKLLRGGFTLSADGNHECWAVMLIPNGVISLVEMRNTDLDEWASHQADLGKEMQLEDNYPYF